ncbi:hypothetical protein PG994_005594, partial [Apiospora phragmitis]
IIHRSRHAELIKGEFESQRELHKYLPGNVAVPVGYGTLASDPSSSFFLTAFLNLCEEVPGPAQVAEVLKKLHGTSVSPNGRFGFHIPTFNGVVPLVNEWCDTWEEYFARQLRSDIEWEHSIRGPDPEFDTTADEFFEKVIPGSCVHSRREKKHRTDAVGLAMMREPRYHFTGEHVSKYLEAMPPSEPVEDFDDRNALYAMRDNIINAGLHDHRAFLRDKVKEEMRRLIAKHPLGIDGFKKVDNMATFEV